MPNNQDPTIILTDADGFAALDTPAFVLLDISKQEIEAMNIASAIERLHIMTDSERNALRYRESLAFQVSGYDRDPRELPEIQEVRQFFAAMVAEWPHWFWFLSRKTGCIALLLSLLCQVRVHRHPGRTGFGTEFVDEHELECAIEDLFHRGNALFETYNIPTGMIRASAESAIQELLPN